MREPCHDVILLKLARAIALAAAAAAAAPCEAVELARFPRPLRASPRPRSGPNGGGAARRAPRPPRVRPEALLHVLRHGQSARLALPGLRGGTPLLPLGPGLWPHGVRTASPCKKGNPAMKQRAVGHSK